MQSYSTSEDAEYVKKNRPVFARYGARILVRWGQHHVVEGLARSRQVVFEFPDYESAVACYHDPEYEAAHKLRVGAADGDVVIVEGYDGPSPPPVSRDRQSPRRPCYEPVSSPWSGACRRMNACPSCIPTS